MDAQQASPWYAHASRCPVEDLDDHLTVACTHHGVGPEHWIVYWIDRARLADQRPDDLGSSTSGAAFCSNGEVRWRVDRGEAQVVVIRRLDQENPPGADVLTLDESGETRWVLTGVYRDGRWVDARLPRPLDYDVGHLSPQDGQRLAVKMVRLSDRAGAGATAFLVHQDIELIEGV